MGGKLPFGASLLALSLESNNSSGRGSRRGAASSHCNIVMMFRLLFIQGGLSVLSKTIIIKEAISFYDLKGVRQILLSNTGSF
jgi:hypothetical protein